MFRHDIFSLQSVEQVRFVAPDPCKKKHYFVVVDQDTLPWHEDYADNDFYDETHVQPYAFESFNSTTLKKKRKVTDFT